MKLKFLFLALSLVFVAAACNKKTAGQTPNLEITQVEVLVSDSGFSPNELTIKQGSTVTFVNQASRPVWPASTPHPTHTDYPEFDARQAIAPGSSWSFTFEKAGEWDYHDHLSPFRKGTVTVVE